MAGLFDDLIPASNQQSPQGGLFDDLIPAAPDMAAAERARAGIQAAIRSGAIRPSQAMQFNDPTKAARVAETVQGMTLGLGDEISGALAGTSSALKGGSYGDAYSNELTNQRQTLADYGAKNPGSAAAMQAVGSLPLSMIPIPKPFPGITGLPGAMLRGATTGGGVGAAYGFNTGEGGIVPRLENAGKVGGTSAVIGAALPPILEAGTQVGRSIKSAVRAVNPNNAPRIAGDVLNQIVGPGGAQFETAPLPDMALTAGQASNNPGLLFAERAMERTPQGFPASVEGRTQNNQAIVNAIESIGDTAADNAPRIMAQRIEAASNAGKSAYRAAWKAAGIDENTTRLPVAELKSAIGDYVAGLAKADQQAVPSSIASVMNKFGDAETLKEVQALRSHVGGLSAQAARSGDTNGARIIGGIADKISDYLDTTLDPALNVMGGTPADQAAYNAARAATRSYKETFVQPKEIRNVLGVDRFGADRVPESAVADQFIRTGKGAPEALGSYLQAVGNDPQARDAARNAFARKFLDTVSTAQPDQAGTRFVNPAKITGFIDDYRHVINSGLFTDAQRTTIENIAKAADMASRTARATPPGGSDTVANLMGKQFLDVIVGRGASRVPAAIGAVTGMATHGPLGAVVGGLAGEGANTAAERLLFGPTRERVMTTLQEALRTPTLAEALMMPPRASAPAVTGREIVDLLAQPNLSGFGARTAQNALLARLLGNVGNEAANNAR